MREIKFNYKIALSEEENERVIDIILTLKDLEDTIDIRDFIYESIEEKLHNEYCLCQLNESNTSCDCDYDWDGNFLIIARLQYTGIKDKNGVEIYEGDIVSINDPKELFTVVFQDASFYPSSELLQKCDDGYNLEFYKIEGNIYENKDLLN